MHQSKRPTTGLKIRKSKILGIKKYKVFILILKITFFLVFIFFLILIKKKKNLSKFYYIYLKIIY